MSTSNRTQIDRVRNVAARRGVVHLVGMDMNPKNGFSVMPGATAMPEYTS